MRYRTLGRTGWQISDIGAGMWGLAAWKGNDEEQVRPALQLAVDLGCNFFDTAWGYGAGASEKILGELVRANPDKKLYTASKIPPRNFAWPSHRGDPLSGSYPADHIREYTKKSLANMGVDSIDLMQFHVWEDDWADDPEWQKAIRDLKSEGLIKAAGISINRWEPWNALRTIQTGQIDTVQVIYNIFDQNPEDELFPLCREYNVGVIARVPFDEGSLTGTLTKDSHWPEGDWRNGYFVPENLKSSVEHADRLKPLVPEGLTMPDLALRFILANQDVATIIPGMSRLDHVRDNIANSEATSLSTELLAELRQHRWDRQPTEWSR